MIFSPYDHVTGSMKGIVLLAFGFSRILEEVHTCTNIILLNSTHLVKCAVGPE